MWLWQVTQITSNIFNLMSWCCRCYFLRFAVIKYFIRRLYRYLRRPVPFSLDLMVFCECWYLCCRVGGNLTSLRCQWSSIRWVFFVSAVGDDASSLEHVRWLHCKINGYVATMHPGKSLVEVCNFTIQLLHKLPHFRRHFPNIRRQLPHIRRQLSHFRRQYHTSTVYLHTLTVTSSFHEWIMTHVK